MADGKVHDDDDDHHDDDHDHDDDDHDDDHDDDDHDDGDDDDHDDGHAHNDQFNQFHHVNQFKQVNPAPRNVGNLKIRKIWKIGENQILKNRGNNLFPSRQSIFSPGVTAKL